MNGDQKPDSRSSVEITRNSKGETQFVVKVYRDPGLEEEAQQVAQAIYDELSARYSKRIEFNKQEGR